MCGIAGREVQVVVADALVDHHHDVAPGPRLRLPGDLTADGRALQRDLGARKRCERHRRELRGHGLGAAAALHHHDGADYRDGQHGQPAESLDPGPQWAAGSDRQRENEDAADQQHGSKHDVLAIEVGRASRFVAGVPQ